MAAMRWQLVRGLLTLANASGAQAGVGAASLVGIARLVERELHSWAGPTPAASRAATAGGGGG